MSTDPTALAASPSVVTLGGVDYKVPQLRFRDLADFLAYVKELHPDPRVAARRFMDGVPDAVATHIYDRACEDAKSWPPRLDGPEVGEAMLEPEGQARLVHIALRRTVAGFTLENARDVVDAMTPGDIERFMDAAMPGVTPDPKAVAPADPAGASSTGTASSSPSA